MERSSFLLIILGVVVGFAVAFLLLSQPDSGDKTAPPTQSKPEPQIEDADQVHTLGLKGASANLRVALRPLLEYADRTASIGLSSSRPAEQLAITPRPTLEYGDGTDFIDLLFRPPDFTIGLRPFLEQADGNAMLTLNELESASLTLMKTRPLIETSDRGEILKLMPPRELLEVD